MDEEQIRKHMVKTNIYQHLCFIHEDYRLRQMKENMPYLSFPDFVEKILQTRILMESKQKLGELTLIMIEITNYLKK